MTPSVPFVYLASQSPRRRELLDQLHIAHTVLPADADEDVEALEVRHGQESPRAYVRRVTRLKAAAARDRVLRRALPNAPILVGDTTVAIEQRHPRQARRCRRRAPHAREPFGARASRADRGRRRAGHAHRGSPVRIARALSRADVGRHRRLHRDRRAVRQGRGVRDPGPRRGRSSSASPAATAASSGCRCSRRCSCCIASASTRAEPTVQSRASTTRRIP